MSGTGNANILPATACNAATGRWHSYFAAVPEDSSMRQKQQQAAQRLYDVRQFLDAHAAQLPTVNNSTARKKLDLYIALFDEHGVTQGEASRMSFGVTATIGTIVRTLVVDYLCPIAHIARDEIPNVPELRPLRTLTTKTPKTVLVVTARGMAKAALPFKDVFVNGGLPADFPEQIEASTQSIVVALGERAQHRGRWSGALKGVSECLRLAAVSVRTLDGLVRSAAKDKPDLLANWNRVRKLPRSNPAPVQSIAPQGKEGTQVAA
jgi:hypothetical protein